MKKYLITGYSGFVAKHFLDYLELQGEMCSVLGIDLNAPLFDTQSFKYVAAVFRQIDLLNKEDVDEVIKTYQPHFILHLASYSSVANSWINPVRSFANNTNIFLNLVDQVRLLELNCRILSVGSSEEYGRVSPDMIPLHEQLPTNPISPYAVARVSQEMLSRIYADSYGQNIVLTRSFNHIGPGQKSIFVIPSFAKKLLDIKSGLHEPVISVGNIEVVRDFVDVRDVVRAYYLLLHKGQKGEVYNICSGKGYTLKDVLLQMMDILDIKAEVMVDSNLIRPNDNDIIIGNNHKILTEIGWQPAISLRNSLIDVLNYWQSPLKS